MASLEVQLDAERASTENDPQSNAEQAQSAQRQRSGGTLSPQQGGSNRSSPTTLHADDRRGSEERGGAPGGGGGAGASNEETAGPGGSSSPVAGSPSASGSPPSTPSSQQFCLRWNNYQSNLTTIFDQLLQNECFVDVTLACDGRSMKAHKMVLSACSPYFQTLLAETPCQHPIVIMRDVSWGDLKAIVEFMYRGEINMLKVRGLADVTHMEAATAAAAAGALEARDSHKEATERDTVEQREAENCWPVMPPEKKLRGDWDYHPSSSGGTSAVSTAGGNLELRLSPLERQQGRNVRKRRWPSADTIFNPPASPLSSLIAAERLELEQKERERQRDCSLMTPPPKPQLQGAGGGGGGARSNTTTKQQQQQQQHPLHMPPVPPHHSHAQHLGLSPVSSQHGVSSASASPAEESRYPLGPTAAAMAAAMELSGLPPPAEPRLPPPPPHHHSQGVGGGGGGGGVGSQGVGPSGSSLADDMEIKPGIAEMIREEERVSRSFALTVHPPPPPHPPLPLSLSLDSSFRSPLGSLYVSLQFIHKTRKESDFSIRRRSFSPLSFAAHALLLRSHSAASLSRSLSLSRSPSLSRSFVLIHVSRAFRLGFFISEFDYEKFCRRPFRLPSVVTSLPLVWNV
ncbi:GL26926 [Drosophila persimilis]|uniref:GL26926 n=1 Tax=Drosophila persimilis TaxID=7234 RepID=B4HD17_DROPE|nr:GL26926 [Drosophila persimilis]